MVLPDVPVQCPPVLFGKEGLSYWRGRLGEICVCGLKLAYVLGHWQAGRSWGGIRGGVVITAEAVYTVGEAGD